MNFDDDQFRRTVENVKSDVPKIKKDCEPFYYSCSSIFKSIDSTKIPEDILNVLNFNQQVINLTEKLWTDLLNLTVEQNIRLVDDTCFSIVDADKCVSLNKYFFYYNSRIQKLLELCTDFKSNVNYLYLLNESLLSLESFLSSTLPRLENNIKNLTIQILQSLGDKSISTSYNVNHFKVEINVAIKNYLKRLSKAVSQFKFNDVPDDLLSNKEKIKTKIKGAIDKKNEFLTISLFEDKTNAFYDSNTFPKTLISFDLKTTFKLNPEETRKFDENPLMVGQVFNNDIHEKIVYENKINDFERSRAEHLSSDRINGLESTPLSNNNMFLYASILSITGFIVFLVFLIFRKYKSKKDKINEGELIFFDEERF